MTVPKLEDILANALKGLEGIEFLSDSYIQEFVDLLAGM